MKKEFKFWEWFVMHNHEYANLESVSLVLKEKRLNALLDKLHKYSKELYFQIGSDVNNTLNEIVITADGDVRYFSKVQQLVDVAPKIKNWNVVAFKQPMGINFETNYEGVLLEPKNIWFLPLENESTPDVLGLRVCLPNYDVLKEKTYLAGVYQVLDTMLGEKSCALDIQHVEIDQLPENPDKHGLIELIELPNYVEWIKSKT